MTTRITLWRELFSRAAAYLARKMTYFTVTAFRYASGVEGLENNKTAAVIW